MPIEIKELHIKINVAENEDSATSNGFSKDEKDKIIEACVEQIMDILSKKEER
jgi:hypothetical protein